MAGFVEQRHVLHESFVRRLAEQVAQHRVAQRTDVHASSARAVVVRALEQMHLSPTPIVDADEHAVAMNRPGNRMAGNVEIGLDVAHEFERILANAIALVDEREDRHPPAFANREQLPCPILDATTIVEQHHRAVGCNQCAIRVLGEVLVARRVEQVDLIAVVLELHDARRDGNAALLLQLHPIRSRMPRRTARLDRPSQVDGAAVQQQLFRERRLTGVRMADDGKRAAGAHGVPYLGLEIRRQRNRLD